MSKAPLVLTRRRSESVRGGEVPIPTVHGASPLLDESSVLKGGGPCQAVTQDAVKTRRIHPAFAFRTLHPRSWKRLRHHVLRLGGAHPAFAPRPAQPTSAVVDLALTINQSSEIADLAPPATRPPRGLHLQHRLRARSRRGRPCRSILLLHRSRRMNSFANARYVTKRRPLEMFP